MNNLHKVLTGLLAVAVIVLFYLQFKEPVGQPAGENPVVVSNPVSTTIVYVNSDSLLDNYVFYKNKVKELEAKEDQFHNQLKSESERLQNDIMAYQEMAAGMTPAEREKKEMELQQRQEAFIDKKDRLSDTFDDEQLKFNEELHNKISAFMKDFNKDKNYSFILGYKAGGGVLFANDSLDITRQVLEGLNKEYQTK